MRLLSILLLCFTLPIQATNYYFSSTGSDGNSGLTPGLPKQTESAIQTILSSVSAGDSVFFARGSLWRDIDLSISSSGTSGNNIYLGAYGTGNDPVLSGALLLTTFSQNGNVYTKTGAWSDYNSTSGIMPLVYIDNAFVHPARYPETGYLTCTTANSSSITDSDLGATTNQFAGGFFAYRPNDWTWMRRIINSNTSTIYTLASAADVDDQYYFVYNTRAGLTYQNAWRLRSGTTDTLQIYSTSNISGHTVEIANNDAVISITGDYITIEGITIEKGISYCVKMQGNIGIVINDCTVKHSYYDLIKCATTAGLTISNSSLSYGHTHGIGSYYSGDVKINNNVLSFMHYYPAICADTFMSGSGGCAIGLVRSGYNSIGKVLVEKNEIHTVSIAIQTHWSHDEVRVWKNYIHDYGGQLQDIGAIYTGGDFTVPKLFTKNAIIDGVEGRTIDAGSSFGSGVHAFYHDYFSNSVSSDSNLIVNANWAANYHVCNGNTFNRNNVVNAAGETVYPWRTALKFDETSYHTYSEGSLVQNIEVLNNNIVAGEGENEVFIMCHTLDDISDNYFNNNKYFDPYTEDGYVGCTGANYSGFALHDLTAWRSVSGEDGGSTYNPTGHTFADVSGITEAQFTRAYYNWSESSHSFSLGSAVFKDVDGTNISGSVSVPAFGSKILFYVSGSLTGVEDPLYLNITSGGSPDPEPETGGGVERIPYDEGVNVIPYDNGVEVKFYD